MKGKDRPRDKKETEIVYQTWEYHGQLEAGQIAVREILKKTTKTIDKAKTDKKTKSKKQASRGKS